MSGAIVSTAEAGRSLTELLTGLEDNTYFITDGNGNARAVLLDIDRYNAMMDAIEDEEAIPDAKIATALVKAIIRHKKKESQP